MDYKQYFNQLIEVSNKKIEKKFSYSKSAKKPYHTIHKSYNGINFNYVISSENSEVFGKNFIGLVVEIFITKNYKFLYNELLKNKDKINKEINLTDGKMEWLSKEKSKKGETSRIIAKKSVDLENVNKWNEYINWQVETMQKFWEVFPKYVDKIEFQYEEKNMNTMNSEINSQTTLKTKNLILYGVPGVGKTHNINKLINLIESKQSTHEIFQTLQKNEKSNEELSEELKNRVKFVTFHQSFGYEDFIEGFRPNENGDIEIQEGIFKRICHEASKNPERNHYLVIDEINRGNISKIFGELITLIEEDKRDKLEVTLPYSKEPFKVPSNLFIIGTMNTADKSIALIDVALRRRFTFVKMKPNADLIEYPKAKEIFKKLNDFLKDRLDEDHLIGHSYFMGITSDEELIFVLDYKIEPLLEEYFYGDKEGLEEAKKKCTISSESGSGTSNL